MLEKFYHSTIRKAVVSFGTLFNNMYIDRKNADGVAVQTLKIPLSYSPRQKFLARIETITDADTKRDVETVIPRMSFEMLQIMYDPNRRVSYIQQNRAVGSGSTAQTQYAPSPYNIEMALYAYVKNQEDGLQIIEQILPYFNPDFNLSITAIPELNIQNDLPIVLNDISYDDQYEGDFLTRRAIMYTLNFTMKLNFYGPITPQGVIRTAKVNTFDDDALSNQISKYTVTPTPFGSNQGNVAGFNETITENFEDF